jgi:hypothetical protein
VAGGVIPVAVIFATAPSSSREERIMARLNLHDGYTVLINTFRAKAMQVPQFQAHMQEVGALIESFDPVLYQLRYSHDEEVRMIEPKDKATILPSKETPSDRVAEAERLYDAPDRREVEEAQQGIKRERTRREHPSSGDAVIDVNVRKPI